jgi:DNA-binding response OmpR family regulator/signal transduction histidine kinase
MAHMAVATATKPALVMLVSSQAEHWIIEQAAEQCDFFPITSAAEAVRALQNVRYDLILVDDVVFKQEAPRVVAEIKRRNPTIPVLMLSDVQDDERQAQLYKAGADDYIILGMQTDEIARHLGLMLRQHRQNRQLAERTQNLHAMASLSRLLFNAQDQYTLLLEATQLLINTYRLYGVAFALRAGEVLHLYAGGEQSAGRGRLYESVIRSDRHDPFSWSIENRITQIYQNIRENQNYNPIPLLAAAESVIILPLTFQDQTVGAMGIFAQPGTSLRHEDLIVFEPFAAQFVVALQKVAQYQAQYVNVQSSQHLLRGWERFANLSAPHEVSKALRELVEEVPHAGAALVWLFDGAEGRVDNALLDTANDEARVAFHRLADAGTLSQLLEQIDANNRPLVYDTRDVQTGPLLPLFHALYAPQVMFVPITDSTRLIGGLFVGARAGQTFTEEDTNLIENLVRTSGQMFERITLTSTIWEKSGRLEAILRTISEGIFFVDENDQIGFCNPQFSEMTGIQPSEVYYQPAELLLSLLAQRTDDPQRSTAQLREAQQIVSKPNLMSEEYPIVDLVLAEGGRTLSVEFVKIEGLDAVRLNWACLLRDRSATTQNEALRNLMQEVISDHLRMPYAQVRTQIGMLTEQHSAFSPRERDQALHELEDNFERFGQLWLNFVDLYNVEMGGALIGRDAVDVPSVVQRLINSRAFHPYSRMIHTHIQQQIPLIRADELRLERAISNLLLVALSLQSSQPLTLTIDRRDKEVATLIGHLTEGAATEIQRLLNGPRASNGQLNPAGFALYVSRELVARQGGHVYLERENNGSYAIIIGLPVAGAALPAPAVTRVVAPESASAPTQPRPAALAPTNGAAAAATSTRAPARPMNTLMVVEGRSTLVQELSGKLEEQEYELLIYDNGEEALRDVNATRLDLVIMDVALRDMSGVDCCARMRARTEVPIILLADKSSETEKLRGLNSGADDYIARPISNEELMARVNTIFKRMTLQERTREPLQLGDLYIDFARREVFLNSKAIELTRIEYDLLHILVTNRGQVLTHKQLLEKVWGPEYENETQYLWVNISRLRKKLEPRADSPRYVQNQLGIGYMFSEP